MADAGWTVLLPERLSVQDQLASYLAADEVLFSERLVDSCASTPGGNRRASWCVVPEIWHQDRGACTSVSRGRSELLGNSAYRSRAVTP